MPRGVYPRKRKAPRAGRRTGGKRMTGGEAGVSSGHDSRPRTKRLLKRQPKDFQFQATEFGLRIQVGKYLVQISELLGNRGAGISEAGEE